jgi:pimeloyl-ACP methyl ester carboxylesterase
VLAFDYRHLGESGGTPRQTVSVKEQLSDWQASIEFACTLPEVDPARLVIWGFSSSGGHVLRVAARNPRLAAAIAQTPLADGPAVMPYALRHQRPLAGLRFLGRGVLDALGRKLGRDPLLVPLAGPPGTVTLLTTPDSLNGAGALNPAQRYPDWQQQVAAGSALRLSFYRPVRSAPRIQCPLLVLVYERDGAALPGPGTRAARRAPRGELISLPGGHYEPFTAGHESALEAQLSFLQRHLGTVPSPGSRPAKTEGLR